MYANLKMSVVAWVIGFLTFLAGLNCVNAAVIWGMNGINATVPLYLVGNLAPSLSQFPVALYFLLSATATFVLLGATVILTLQRPAVGLEVQRMMTKIEDEMVATRAALESTRISLFAKMEDEKIARKDLLTIFNQNLESLKTEMLDTIEREKGVYEDLGKDLEQIANEVNSLRQEAQGNSDVQSRMIGAIERLSQKADDANGKAEGQNST